MDKLTLILWALTFNVLLLDCNIFLLDIPKNIINDLMLKSEGYIYAYQTLISAIIAFFAASFVYKYNAYNKKQKSFIVAFNVRSLIANTCGWVQNLSETINGREKILRYYSAAAEKFDKTIKLFENLDTAALSPDISWHISSCLNTLRNLENSLEMLSQESTWADHNVDLLEATIAGVDTSCTSFLHSYESIRDYIDANFHRFPPHLAKEINRK